MKSVAFCIVGMCLLQNIVTVNAETYGEGLLPTSESVLITHMDEDVEPCTGVLPSSVDLSNSVYFPNIRSQGGLGSCAPCSIVYYQFSYEVNRLNSMPYLPIFE